MELSSYGYTIGMAKMTSRMLVGGLLMLLAVRRFHPQFARGQNYKTNKALWNYEA